MDKQQPKTNTPLDKYPGSEMTVKAINEMGSKMEKIIDEDYQGEIHIHVINVGNNCITLTAGMKIAQFILVPVFYDNVEVVDSREELFPEESDRGAGDFGSTNK